MGHCSIRSLLLAAIVISNCITWTASRHHYTHNVHGHRSRHRRMGAGLFLSSSYVIPGGEGAGAWGEWGEVSPCSRTCGGGVASQKRICLEVGPDGQPNCSGGDTKFFSCETADCPDGSSDFRAQQCSEHDDDLFRGIKYTWVPYTKGPKPCELNCMPRGERFYYRHKSKVIDGTRCNEDSFDVCVDGQCQPVGCDFMLGSAAREDKCRVCRGNGTNCRTITDLLDSQDARSGYVDLLLIPQGATSINIGEVRPSSNYLAIRALNNTYYLNGDYHIDFPRSMEIAGAIWHYERASNGLSSPDKLRCLGPTNEPLFLSMLILEPNVGVQYEYSIPEALAPPPNQEYHWVYEEFTPCSETCGGGIQTRNVSCRSREELELVNEDLCNVAFKPVTNQTCNTSPCPATWVEGPWGPCSKHCGEGGSRSREVYCEKIITNGYPSVVADKECFELLGPKPPLFEECNQNASCPTWFAGPWKPCDKLCDEGKQTRQVVCHQKSGGRVELLEDNQCKDEKPAAEQPCMIHPCDGVDWMVTDWSGCDTCLSTVRTRSAVCATKDYKVVNDSLCSYHPAPVLEEPCDKAELPACTVQWYATQWSKCSAECGKGVQTRRVFCGLFDGESVLKVNASRCDPADKYNDTKECEVAKCPSKWYAAPWSECSAKCGGGEQFRRVTCLSGDQNAKCDPDTVLDSTQGCNFGPCDADSTLSVTPGTTPVIDEYDEYCDEDEEYPEVGAEEDSSLTTEIDEMFSDSPDTGFSELESELTLDVGSGLGSEVTEGSGYGSTASTWSTEGTESLETGSGEDTISTETEITGSTVTDLSSSPLDTDATSASSESSESTVESSTETSNGTESTDLSSESSTYIDYDYDSTVTGSSETDDTSATDETTISGPTETSVSTESGATEASRSSDESTISGATESSVSEETGSTVSGPTDTSGSTELEYTDITESDYTDDSKSTATDETVTDETTESSTDESTLSTSSDSETTEETSESSSTESSGSTEISDETTEIGTTEAATGSSESTDAESTESSIGTESEPTESSGSTESESTDASGATDSTTEGGTTESGATELSTTESADTGSTESSESTETPESGATESSGPTDSTESGATEASGPTDSTESGATESSGPTETTESGATETSGPTETTEEGSTESSGSTTEGETGSTEFASEGSTESITEGTGSTVSGAEETGSTETGSSEGTTESVSSVSGEESTILPGSTPYDWSTTFKDFGKASGRQCKRRMSKCTKSKFGCCPDKRTAAAGPFDEGCPAPKTCAESEFGCCPDGVSPAQGPRDRGCPVEDCAQTLFGCCSSDNKTAAEGNDQEGCPPPPPPCKLPSSKYGCCKDEKTEATGPKKQGCPETEKAKEKGTTKVGETTTTISPAGANCNGTEFGCCPDGVSPAAGAQMEGCVMSCNSSAYGCCPDGETPAHGYDYEGCCLLYPYGCCPDNFKPAEGPHLEGCGCEFARYGCCPDNLTIASGPNNEGCSCEYSEHGCCPDRHTPASGPENAGCGCHTFQFGCCEDGVTTAKGPGNQGCLCQQSEFGCCGDEKTAAVGPDQAGCDCSTSKYGCCPDGETPAKGSKFYGCTDKPVIRQAACALSTDRGSCSNYSVYWYYDMQYGGCSRFWYGGCEGNGNRFTSKEECEDVCVHPAPKDSCNLPKVTGACTGYHPRWFYNPDREHCEQFIFGGCLGNANNFDSRELCQKQCEPAKSDDQCSLPIDRGSCAGNFLRWGWSAESGRCEQFVWGGCEGNTNRFSSESACQHRCNPPGVPKPQCKQPHEAGNCTEKQPAWAFSQPENRCVPYYYSGCEGNENRFDSQRSCAEACPSLYVKDMCTLPAVTGECAEYTEKWYYDTAIKRCRQFYYGGCGGNENRFSSQLECESRCSELVTTTLPPPTQQTTPADVCAQPSETGNCDNYVIKWYFDANSDRCLQFYYGGCGGNGNRYDSEAACAARCAPARTTTTLRPLTNPPASVEEVCFMSADSGPCTELHERWAYDAALATCVPFTFGGCGGNQNNFPDKEYCLHACRDSIDVCQLPMLTGSCDESVMQWFYDPSSDSCSQFTYSGCGGNSNRFPTLEACERRCRAPAPAPVASTTLAANFTTPAPGEELPAACHILPEANEECVGEEVVWYLDVSQHACVAFTNVASGYSCRRTGVHVSEEACERTCGAFRNIEVCRYPKEPGPCRGAIPKFYFDEALGSCVEFAYGGCHGGPNRFSSIDECEDVCKFEKDPCKRTPKPLNCDYVDAWFYDEAHDNCYQYASCDRSERFATQAECEGQCARAPPAPRAPPATPAPTPTPQNECATPRLFERCDNATVTFYYDAERRQCVRSSHGYCGHANSYGSEEECERQCGAFVGIDPCRSPLDVGGCDSSIPKFYWKLSSGRCEPFAYSGCGGGANRFSSADECQRVCSGTGPEPACLERVEFGEECEVAPSRRWYYSERDADCRPFVFLGCGGGANNFRLPGDCARACRTTLDVRGNEVDPVCDQFNEECDTLRCEFGVQRTRTASGCERCSCVTVEVDCAPLQQECETLKCAYGVRKATAADGCERCTCYEHPCVSKECPAGERCVTIPYRNPITQEVGYTADCRITNKTGSCPLVSAAEASQCRLECNDDADCVGVGKCCARGCSQLCLEPATPTSPAPVTTTYAPELPQAPHANPMTEPEVRAEEGGKATLRCLFHGNPPPKITWRRGEITIDSDVGRYRLLSDGALEIVSLFRNDSGVYICVGENVHGVSQQEVHLQVNDPVDSPAGIAGDANAVVYGELGRSLNIRCLAYGSPAPSIWWYRGTNMLPYSSDLYEARENVLQIRRLDEETLGEYVCQAFNGQGAPAVWGVEVRARRPPAPGDALVPRVVDITPAQPRLRPTTTTPAPEIDVPVYTVAVNTHIPFEQTEQAVGAELSLPCDVDGYPLPEVFWTKDNVRLSPDSRTQITDARLTISGLRLEDSGVYGCHARNEYSSHSSTIQINVQGVIVPVHCTDNPFFADCKLIVRSKFCTHRYYSKFCCESCVKAGQLNALELGTQADEAYKRK